MERGERGSALGRRSTPRESTPPIDRRRFMRWRFLSAALAATVLCSCSSHSSPPVLPAGGPLLSQAAQPEFAGTWYSFPIQGQVVAMARGLDGNMWAGVLQGTDDSICSFSQTEKQTCFSGGGFTITSITSHPDLNVYAAGDSQSQGVAIIQVTTQGGETIFPLPNPDDPITSVVTASDQRIWMSRSSAGGDYVAAVSTTGKYRQFPTRYPNGIGGLARGSDTNVWGESGAGSTFNLVRLDIKAGRPTFFPEPGGQLLRGPDGAFYGPGKQTVYRFDPKTGTETTFTTKARGTGPAAFFRNHMYWLDVNEKSNTAIVHSFNIVKDELASRAPAPVVPDGIFRQAPNYQIWLGGAVDTMYILQLRP
jgi:hypothetical protein